MNHGNDSLSLSFCLSLFKNFLHADSLCFPNTRRLPCQNFPLRGIQLWSSCLYRFYTGNSFPKTDYGDFWISLSFFFLHGTKPLLKEWMRWGRLIAALLPLVAHFHTTLPANTQSLNRIEAQKCVIGSSCHDSHLSVKQFCSFFYIHHSSQKKVKGSHSLLLGFTFICIFDNERQNAVGSIWTTGVTLKKPNALFCLGCSGQREE